MAGRGAAGLQHRARTPIVLATLAALLLPGCLDAVPAPTVEDGGDSVADGCALTYPDDSPVDCDAPAFTEPVVAESAPTVTDGWTCRRMYDSGNRQAEVFSHTDGRTGVRFDYREMIGDLDFPPNGVAVYTVSAYGGSMAQSASAAFDLADATGFLALPEPLGATPVNVYSHLRVFHLLEKQGTEWRTVEADLLVSEHAGGPWFAWRWTPPGASAPIHVDVMDPTAGGDPTSAAHTPRDSFDVAVGAHTLSAALWQHGVVFRDQTSARPPTSDCLELAP